MSQENVEIVRRVYKAVERGDTGAVLAAYEPDVEFDFSGSPLGIMLRHNTYRGHEGMRDFFRERRDDAWGTIKDGLEELIDTAEDQVVSVVTTRGRGRVSEVPVELTHAGVWKLRDGRVVRVEWYPSRDAALEAAGLSE